MVEDGAAVVRVLPLLKELVRQVPKMAVVVGVKKKKKKKCR